MDAPDLSGPSGFPSRDGPADVAEISLLLPGWQLSLLESAARERGLSPAQVVRRLIRDFCDRYEEGELPVGEKQNVACQW
jgi:hypothetical protein